MAAVHVHRDNCRLSRVQYEQLLGLLICLILLLSTATALADRPVTQEDSERLQDALKEQGCSGGKMEFDDGKFEVEDARCADGKTYDLEFDSSFRLIRKKLEQATTTYTGVGHATLLSCAHPYKHGVVGNDWIDKRLGDVCIRPKTHGSSTSTRKRPITQARRLST
jgi:hypothetical protein